MKLYVDPRSSSSLRVLCYLRHKGLALEVVGLSLRDGEHRHERYARLNPSLSVPALELDAGDGVITQSLAILEFLEARHAEPSAMPPDEVGRARVRALCGLVAADIHPLTNMRVRQEVLRMAGDEAAQQWVGHWTRIGLAAVEGWLAQYGGRFAVGDDVTLADFFIAPLAFNARRFGCELPGNVARVFEHCIGLDAFELLR